jgi:hypothetical protein
VEMRRLVVVRVEPQVDTLKLEALNLAHSVRI